jgi:hypothetical protein
MLSHSRRSREKLPSGPNADSSATPNADATENKHSWGATNTDSAASENTDPITATSESDAAFHHGPTNANSVASPDPLPNAK